MGIIIRKGTKPTVWVLKIWHKHGEEYEIFATKRAAERELRNWCENWWGDREDKYAPEVFPEDWPLDDILSSYFKGHDSEGFELEEEIVQW